MIDASERLTPAARRSVSVVWVVIFLDLLSFGLVLPSLAYYVDYFGIPAWAEDVGLAIGMPDTRAVFVGAMQAAYSGFQFVFAPLWGAISDRVGRKPVLLLSLTGFCASWLIFAWAPTLAWLLAARVLAGAFGANISTAQAYMADVFPEARRAKGMGLVGMAFGLGFVFGPALGALLSSDAVLSSLVAPDRVDAARITVPALFAAGLSGAAALLGLVALRESLPPGARRRRPPRPRLAELTEALRRPRIGLLLAVHFIAVTGFAGLETLFSQFNLEVLRLPQSTNGLVFTAVGLTLAAVQGGLIGPLTARLGNVRVLMIGLAGVTAFMAAFGWQAALNPGLSPVVWLVFLAGAVGGSFSLVNPSVLALISRFAARDALGETMGVTASAATLGRVVGPFIGGLVYARFGPQWPFAVAASFTALGLGLLYRHRQRVAAGPG